MYLIKTALRGTMFVIEFIENQVNKAPVGVDTSSSSIKGDWKILSKFPIGTMFAVSDIKWGEIESSILGNVRPLFCDTTLYVNSVASENTASNSDVEYLIDWMISSPEYKKEGARAFSERFNEVGYKIDFETKCATYTEDTSGSLRDRIIRQYPCPTEAEIGFHIEPDVWYLLIRNIIRNENTLLIGPTGLKNQLLFA